MIEDYASQITGRMIVNREFIYISGMYLLSNPNRLVDISIDKWIRFIENGMINEKDKEWKRPLQWHYENMINCKEIGLGKDHSVMAQIKAKTSSKIELWMLVNTYVLPSILLVNSLQ